MSSINKYFLPSDYIDNPPLTFGNHPRDYWTDVRISSSHHFQYHVYEYAGELFKKKSMSSLMDIGAGPGTKIPFFFDVDKINLVLVDQPGMDEVTKRICPNAEFHGVNLDNERINLGSKFDMIICSDVIEHLANPENLLTIIKDHLSPGGVAVLSTPDREMRRNINDLQSPNKAHVREWTSNELKQYLLSQGFQVLNQRNLPLKRLQPWKFWFSQKILYRKMKRDNWFACQMLILRLK